MPSIKNLEMAAALSTYKHISIKNTLFGLSQKAVYMPTGSPVSIIVNEYAAGDGERLERLLSLPQEQLDAELQAKAVPAPSPIGHFRLEACLSKDRQFCALQLFRFGDFKYTPATPVRFFEGASAESVAKLF